MIKNKVGITSNLEFLNELLELTEDCEKIKKPLNIVKRTKDDYNDYDDYKERPYALVDDEGIIYEVCGKEIIDRLMFEKSNA